MSEIHIIAPFYMSGGREWSTIDLYLELSQSHTVKLWSPKKPADIFNDYAVIHEIKPYSGQLPEKGKLIISGTRTEIGPWFDQIKYDQTILIHDEFTPLPLYKALNRLARSPNKIVQLQYVSKAVKETAGLQGNIRYPFPNIERLKPVMKEVRHQPAHFTVGRISRDTINKHHYRDPAMYRVLSQKGYRFKLAGATCLQPWLRETQNIELSGEIPQHQIAQFLSELDCFYYRTSLGFKEAFGLVVVEAMLAGLPVVCYRQGGYAEVIRHGETGFLFSSDDEAVAILEELRQSPQLAYKIGVNARESIMDDLRLQQSEQAALGL